MDKLTIDILPDKSVFIELETEDRMQRLSLSKKQCRALLEAFGTSTDMHPYRAERKRNAERFTGSMEQLLLDSNTEEKE